MEKSGRFVANGGVKLPIGFRFRPTDEELVVHYLKRKAMALPLPASVIPVVEVFRSNPWDLPGDLKEMRYFFSRGREGNTDNAKKVRVGDGSGFWKDSGKEKCIIGSGIVAVRKTLNFFHGKSSGGLKSSWVMHEFKLSMPNSSILVHESGDWIVCRIYEKKKRVKCNNHNRQFSIHLKKEFERTSSPCSSEITDEEQPDDDEEETASYF